MRDHIEAAIKDAYYAARDNGGTMHTAATDATDAVLAILGAPDEATVKRLARVGAEAEGFTWDLTMPEAQDSFRDNTRAVLATLADTPAQARHTADDTTGGGEDG